MLGSLRKCSRRAFPRTPPAIETYLSAPHAQHCALCRASRRLESSFPPPFSFRLPKCPLQSLRFRHSAALNPRSAPLRCSRNTPAHERGTGASWCASQANQGPLTPHQPSHSQSHSRLERSHHTAHHRRPPRRLTAGVCRRRTLRSWSASPPLSPCRRAVSPFFFWSSPGPAASLPIAPPSALQQSSVSCGRLDAAAAGGL